MAESDPRPPGEFGPAEGAEPDALGTRNTAGAWIEYAAYRIALGGLSRMPFAWQRGFAGFVAWAGTRFEHRHSDPGRRYIAQALGGELGARAIEDLLVAAWRHLVLVVLEDAAFDRRVLARGAIGEHFDVHLSDEVKAARDQGRGGFVVTPHVGMWEMLPVIAMTLGFRPGFVVSRPPKNRPLSRYTQRQRRRRGYDLIHPTGAVTGIKAAIDGGGWVGLMLDQRAHGKTVIAPFFGRPVRCLRTVPVLVSRLGRPVVFGACYRTERPLHYRLVAERVLWPEQVRHCSPEETAGLINQEIERMIRAAPDQYLWLHDRFRGAPT